jgi:hypothetical protein
VAVVVVAAAVAAVAGKLAATRLQEHYKEL